MVSFFITPHVPVTCFVSPLHIIQNLTRIAAHFTRGIGYAIPAFYKIPIKRILANWLRSIVQLSCSALIYGLLSENQKTMFYVFRSRYPFEIFEMVVMLIPIFMIHLGFMIWIRKKNIGNKPVNGCLNDSSIRLQIYFQISVALRNWLKHFYRLPRKTGTDFPNFIDLIETIIAGYFFPHKRHLRTEILYHEPRSNSSMVRNVLV